jgi:hypothetical protein
MTTTVAVLIGFLFVAVAYVDYRWGGADSPR